ncbi:MAG: hypothetical protein AAGF88_01375 [Pseudomonadota bacterium]
MAEYRDLTGHWVGLYRYTAPNDPVPVEIEFVDDGGALTGTSREPNTFRPDLGSELSARLAGERVEAWVQFTKTYEGFSQPGGDPNYEGLINAGFTRIAGLWHFPEYPGFGGSFVLHRKPIANASITREQSVDIEV